MKNLKQVLALGMAFSLTMSSMAGAAFTDQADIKATEAVNMLSALGVIKGYEDGSFKPEGTVTRAEAAKMIFTIRNGGNDDASAWAGTPTSFTDLAGYGWAEGYIKYCQSMGIIAGKSATSFDPGAQVTGTELAKMVLVTMGYNAETAGLTGAAWANKTLGLAGENGLLDDVASNLAAGLPRQYAAQMLYNGVNADVVTYVNGQYQKVETTKTEWIKNPNGNEWQAVQVTTNKTLGNAYMSLETTTVTLNSVSYDSAKKTYTLNTTGGAYTKVTEDYSALVGQKVNVLHKKGATDSVYGVYADENVKVVDSVVGKLETVSGKNDTVKVDGTEYKTNGALSTIDVYAFNATSAYTKLNTLISTDSADAYTVKLIDNDGDNKIDLVVVRPFTVAKVTYVGKTSVTIDDKSIGNKDLADVNVYEGIAKDDYVKVTAAANTVDDTLTYEKLEVVTGEVTATKDSGKEGQINGTWYKMAADGKTFKAGDKVEIAVAGKYAYSYDISESVTSVKDLVYVDQAAKTDGIDAGLSAKLYFTDGTVKTVAISKVGDDKVTSSNAGDYETGKGKDINNKLFTYTMDGDKYELKAVDNDKNKAGFDGQDEGAQKYQDKNIVLSNGTKAKIADDAVLFVESNKGNGTVKVLSGKDVNAWGSASITFETTDAKSNVMYDEVDGFKYVKAGSIVLADTDVPSASGDKAYGFVTDVATISVDGTSYTQFTLWTKDGEKVVKVKATDDKSVVKGEFISYNSGDGTTISDIAKLTEVNNAGAVTAYSAGGRDINLVKVDGTSAVDAQFANKLASDATIIYVNTKDDKGVEGGSIAIADKDTNDVVIANVMYVLNNDKEVEVLFVDTNNDLDDVKNPAQAAKDEAQGKIDTAVATLQGKGTLTNDKYYLVKNVQNTTALTGLKTNSDGVKYAISVLDLATAKSEVDATLSYTDDSSTVSTATESTGTVTLGSGMSAGKSCMLKMVVSDTAGIATAKTVYVLVQYDA